MFNLVKFDYFSDSVFRGQVCCKVGCTMVKRLSPNWTSFKCFYYKKVAVVSNFCLIEKIHHNFLVPRMIELGCKTCMPIQTLDLHRVLCMSDQISQICNLCIAHERAHILDREMIPLLLPNKYLSPLPSRIPIRSLVGKAENNQ